MRPGRLGPQPCGVVCGGDQEQGGGVGAGAVQGEQAGGAGGDERDDQLAGAPGLAGGEGGAPIVQFDVRDFGFAITGEMSANQLTTSP